MALVVWAAAIPYSGSLHAANQFVPGATVTATQGSSKVVAYTDESGRYNLNLGPGVWDELGTVGHARLLSAAGLCPQLRASRMLISVCSRVLPVVMQPGRSGTYAAQLFSACSNKTAYFSLIAWPPAQPLSKIDFRVPKGTHSGLEESRTYHYLRTRPGGGATHPSSHAFGCILI